jgi:hypothetical protein
MNYTPGLLTTYCRHLRSSEKKNRSATSEGSTLQKRKNQNKRNGNLSAPVTTDVPWVIDNGRQTKNLLAKKFKENRCITRNWK